MGNSLLHRYWFKTKKHLGFGVTAYSIEDAKGLVDDAARRIGWSCEVIEIVEDVDVRELDQKPRGAEHGTAEFPRRVVSQSQIYREALNRSRHAIL